MLLIFTFLLVAVQAQPTIFENVQNLTDPTDGVEALSISDDNSIIVAGSHDDRVYVFVHDGTEYALSQTLTEMDNDVEVTDMTGDGKWLIVCGYDPDLYVYYNDNGFILNQTLEGANLEIWAAGITDDHQWIVFGD